MRIPIENYSFSSAHLKGLMNRPGMCFSGQPDWLEPKLSTVCVLMSVSSNTGHRPQRPLESPKTAHRGPRSRPGPPTEATGATQGRSQKLQEPSWTTQTDSH